MSIKVLCKLRLVFLVCFLSIVSFQTFAFKVVDALSLDTLTRFRVPATLPGIPTPILPTLTITEIEIADMSTYVGRVDSESILVDGMLLQNNITATISGADAALFAVKPATIVQANGVAQAKLSFSYSPTSAGNHSVFLNLVSAGASTVTKVLNGSATVDPNPTAIQSNFAFGGGSAIQKYAISVLDGTIQFKSDAGLHFQILDVLGRILVSNYSSEGLNSIPVAVRGIVFVRIANSASKLVIK